MQIRIETSSRHIHLCQDDIDILFPAGLTKLKDLSQPGQYACNERVTVITAGGSLTCRVLGPARSASQLEVSVSDTRTLGIPAIVRQSGNLTDLKTVTVRGVGHKTVQVAVMVPKAHIHMSVEDARAEGFIDGEEAVLQTNSNGRRGMLPAIVRISPSFITSAHIDTDEANALGNTTVGIVNAWVYNHLRDMA